MPYHPLTKDDHIHPEASDWHHHFEVEKDENKEEQHAIAVVDSKKEFPKDHILPKLLSDTDSMDFTGII